MNKLEQAARQAFETWWEREGQEFLFALNTTTDDDIKLVAEIAWKNGAYCAEQAEQEPVVCKSVPVEPTKDMLLAAELSKPRGYRELYSAMINAAPQPVKQKPVAYDWDTIHQVLCEVWNRDSSADEGLEAIQDLIYSEPTIEAKEPVARVPAHPEQGLEWLQPPPVWGTLLYAAPVRIKDLTDDEIWKLYGITGLGKGMALRFARAVIAADREKNK